MLILAILGFIAISLCIYIVTTRHGKRCNCGYCLETVRLHMLRNRVKLLIEEEANK